MILLALHICKDILDCSPIFLPIPITKASGFQPISDIALGFYPQALRGHWPKLRNWTTKTERTIQQSGRLIVAYKCTLFYCNRKAQWADVLKEIRNLNNWLILWRTPPRFLCFIRLSVTKHQASEWTILSGPLSAKIQFKTSRFRAWKQSKQNYLFRFKHQNFQSWTMWRKCNQVHHLTRALHKRCFI